MQRLRHSILIFLVIGWFSCSPDVSLTISEPAVQRGALLEYTLLHDYSTTETDSIIDAYGDFLAGYPVNYPIHIYRIQYTTIDAFGKETIASGAAVIPIDTLQSFPMCSYQHGTITERYAVPSYEGGELFLGIVFAPAGYIMALPDYLGLGDGEGLHPYCHAKTEATAVIDMLRATRQLSNLLQVSYNDQLFLFGYSQGGHATLTATREIELFHANEFNLTASAPMSGPYDMSGAQTDIVVRNEPYAAPYYLPYLMLAYNSVYNMYEAYSDFLQSPYDSLLPPLFDGTYSGGYIDGLMPDIPNQIIKEEVFEDFKNNPSNPFRLALEDNDLIYNWQPSTPTLLFYCTADELVTYQNSLNAKNSFDAQGSTAVNVFDSNPLLGHEGCAEPSFIFCRNWFDSLKE